MGGACLEQGTRILFLSSFLISFASGLFFSFSTSLPANLELFPYFCPLLPFSAKPVPSPKITASQQWWEGTMRRAHSALSPSLGRHWWWLCDCSWDSSQFVPNLCYRWDDIFGANTFGANKHSGDAYQTLCSSKRQSLPPGLLSWLWRMQPDHTVSCHWLWSQIPHWLLFFSSKQNVYRQ